LSVGSPDSSVSSRNKRTVLGDDAEVGAGDEEDDLLAAVLVADMKVAKAAQVAEGDAAAGVEAVAANAVVEL
jgi:hypothetical protein